jgi:hypothetical protein
MEVSGQLHTLEEKAAGTHWTGGRVSPRTTLATVEKRKILPLPGIEPQSSSPQVIDIMTAISALTALHIRTLKYHQSQNINILKQRNDLVQNTFKHGKTIGITKFLDFVHRPVF